MENFEPEQGSTAAGVSGPSSPHCDLAVKAIARQGLPIMTPGDVAELNTLCTALGNTIAMPDYSKDTLLRHAHMLNEMFYKMMDKLTESVPKFELGYQGTAIAALNMQIQQKFAMLALQVQRQCADALRSAHSINYMQSLTQANNLALNGDAGTPSPHPLPAGDQTGKET